MTTPDFDVAVVGGGVVGLAVARACGEQGLQVLVLEAADCVGSGVSSRNSEVIHAGLYYPTGSLKALLCVRGREALYRYCADHGIAHRRCSKLVVATPARRCSAACVRGHPSEDIGARRARRRLCRRQ